MASRPPQHPGTADEIRIVEVDLSEGVATLYIAGPTNLAMEVEVFSADHTFNGIDSAWQLAGEKAMLTGTNLLIYKDSGQFDRLPPSELFRRYYVVGSTADNDEDDVSDAREIFLHNTDPDDPTSCPVVISGTIAYAGWQSETIRVAVVTSPHTWSSPYVATLSAPGTYQFCGLPLEQDYWIKAWVDSNGNGQADPCEPWGWFTNLAHHLTNEVSDIDINIADSFLPNLVVPPNRTVTCHAATSPGFTGMATLEGNPLPAGAFSLSWNDAIQTGCPPVIVRTWTLDDGCSNAVSADQIISILVTNTPSLDLPGDITIDCAESTEPWNTGAPVATYPGVPEVGSNLLDFSSTNLQDGQVIPAVNGIDDLILSGAILIQPGGTQHAYDGNESGSGAGGIDDSGTGNAIAPAAPGEDVTFTFARPVKDLRFELQDIEVVSGLGAEIVSITLFDSETGSEAFYTNTVSGNDTNTGDGVRSLIDLSGIPGADRIRRLRLEETGLTTNQTTAGFGIDNV
ncbi:MAG: hypothetical protein AAF492_18105, partial [Verrucomicrobiota bacterium]